MERSLGPKAPCGRPGGSGAFVTVPQSGQKREWYWISVTCGDTGGSSMICRRRGLGSSPHSFLSQQPHLSGRASMSFSTLSRGRRLRRFPLAGLATAAATRRLLRLSRNTRSIRGWRLRGIRRVHAQPCPQLAVLREELRHEALQLCDALVSGIGGLHTQVRSGSDPLADPLPGERPVEPRERLRAKFRRGGRSSRRPASSRTSRTASLACPLARCSGGRRPRPGVA